MAAIEITISGVLYDKYNRTGRPVTIIGDASLTGLSVGGGPIMPPDQGGGPPPGIWPDPGPLPHPEHPIAPGGPPPSVWPGPGPFPHPEHPIVLPPDAPPIEPPSNPPSGNWEWGWSPAHGWHPVYVTGDKPQPPKP